MDFVLQLHNYSVAIFMIAIISRSKASWLCRRNGLVLVFFLQAGIAAAQNLATNPGFETGTTAGWFAFGSPTISVQTNQVHSGSYAGLVTNRTATYMGIAQSFQGVLQTNQAYNVSVWLQLVSGASQTMQITAQKIDGSGTNYTAIASGTVSTGAWTQLAGQYTLNVSNSLTNLTIYFEVPTSSNASYYIDDLLVESVNTPGSNGQCTVDWNTVYQRIDGFGASSAWQGTWTTNQANMFFSTNNGTGTSLDGTTNFPYTGVGLSLLRNHIVYASSTSPTATPGTAETSIMKMAQTLGARVWSTPWTPASGFKSNDGPDGGNYLGSGNGATNLAYASQLANYVSSMESQGVNIYAISVQNEPDADVTTYEACTWTGSQIHDFVTNLYSALVAKGVSSTKIIIPESESWSGNPGLYTPSLSDTNVAPDVSIIANHDYVANNEVGDTSTPTALPVSGKTVWETEVSQINGGYDGSITNAIYWAGRIYLYMTAAQANAWHYWWLISQNADNEGLTDTNGVPAKRMYVLGQFSRFVRPNFYCINVTNNTGSALVSAYKDSLSPNFAIVAINSSLTTVTQVFNLTNVTGVSTVTPWITSGTMSLSNQATVAVSDSSFSYTLPALSVVTFVGQGLTNTPPVLLPVANQRIGAGVTLVITNVATASDVPPQTLTFSLLNAPDNATLDPSSGIFTWRPLVSQANTTNLITTSVTDNDSANLSATDSFNVIVNPLAQPVINSINTAGGQVSLVINGPVGPDYTLLTSTNLINWQVLFTTNSPVTPITLIDTNFGAYSARFYYIQLGP
jgi:glucuronoarabinoxylan endo-1,4-beta-xylanase